MRTHTQIHVTLFNCHVLHLGHNVWLVMCNEMHHVFIAQQSPCVNSVNKVDSHRVHATCLEFSQCPLRSGVVESWRGSDVFAAARVCSSVTTGLLKSNWCIQIPARWQLMTAHCLEMPDVSVNNWTGVCKDTGSFGGWIVPTTACTILGTSCTTLWLKSEIESNPNLAAAGAQPLKLYHSVELCLPTKLRDFLFETAFRKFTIHSCM